MAACGFLNKDLYHNFPRSLGSSVEYTRNMYVSYLDTMRARREQIQDIPNLSSWQHFMFYRVKFFIYFHRRVFSRSICCSSLVRSFFSHLACYMNRNLLQNLSIFAGSHVTREGAHLYERSVLACLVSCFAYSMKVWLRVLSII